jgi:hypothetical protein
MGRLVLLYSAPDRYGALSDAQDTPLPGADDECRLFGDSHRTLALQAGEHWGLSDRICSVLHGALDPSGLSAGRRQTLATAVRAGSHLALCDLAGAPLTLPSDVPVAETSVPEELMAIAAEDAVDYAANLGGG